MRFARLTDYKRLLKIWNKTDKDKLEMKRPCQSLVRFVAANSLLAFANIVNAADNAEGPTRQQYSDLLAELRKISAALEKQIGIQFSELGNVTTERGIDLDLSGVPMLGKIDAPVTMVEFTDYECSFCRSFPDTVFQAIKRQYIDTGKVRFYVRNLPLTIHPHALT